eukprot:m.132320 g.132320  ORF g.132320 m.132320 type:complete len:268 (-) comp9485_c0_seq5:1158-1961(-)
MAPSGGGSASLLLLALLIGLPLVRAACTASPSQPTWWSCNSQGLAMVPTTLPANTTQLYLNRNLITFLANTSFANLTLVYYLDLSMNRITYLPTRAFATLRNLDKLLLNNNMITVIEAEAFEGLSRLSELTLGPNPIVALPPGAFAGMTFALVNGFTLSACNITAIAAGAFVGLSTTASLDLSWNLLTFIPALTFLGLSAVQVLNHFLLSLFVIDEPDGQSDHGNRAWCAGRPASTADCLLAKQSPLIWAPRDFQFLKPAHDLPRFQ